MPSGEMVAPMIDSFLRDKPRHFPLNLPNAGQCPDLPADVVVEAMVTPDGDGLRGRDHGARAAGARGVAAPDRRRRRKRRSRPRSPATATRSVEAMLLDPLAGRIDFDHVAQMTDEMLAATVHVAPAVRVSSDFAVDELDGPRLRRRRRRWRAPPRSTRPTRIRAAIDERGEANVMLATGNSQLVFLAELVHVHRRRLVAGHRVPHGRVRRAAADASGELPALHARDASPPTRRCRSSTTSTATPATPRPRRDRYAGAARARTRSTCAAAASARTATSRSTIRPSPTSTTRST